MMQYLNIGVAIVACPLIIFSLKIAFEFHSYCEELAKFEGRTAEFASLGSDEYSLNAYQREQYKRLMRGDVAHSDDRLRAKSVRLASRLKMLRAATVLFVIAVTALYLCLG